MTKRVVCWKFYREFPEAKIEKDLLKLTVKVAPQAERDRRITDEHGFRAAHRTVYGYMHKRQDCDGSARYSGKMSCLMNTDTCRG